MDLDLGPRDGKPGEGVTGGTADNMGSLEGTDMRKPFWNWKRKLVLKSFVFIKTSYPTILCLLTDYRISLTKNAVGFAILHSILNGYHIQRSIVNLTTNLNSLQYCPLLLSHSCAVLEKSRSRMLLTEAWSINFEENVINAK